MGRPPRLAGGLVDPAANNCNLADGQALIQWYRKKGLQLQAIENPLETGIVEVGDRMLSGRLKVFESLSRYREERRIYRHDEKGQVVKDRDNLQDATRCLVVGVQSMRTEDCEAPPPLFFPRTALPRLFWPRMVSFTYERVSPGEFVRFGSDPTPR